MLQKLPSWLRLILFASVWLLLAGVGDRLYLKPSGVMPLWLPGGLMTAVLLRTGKGRWAWLLGASLVVSTGFDVLQERPLATGFLFWAVHSLEALLGAGLVLRFTPEPRDFATVRGIVSFSLLSGVLSTAVGALIGTATAAVISGQGCSPWVWAMWWMGDMAGILAIAPLLLFPPFPGAWPGSLRGSLRGLIEAAVLLGSLAVCTGIVFYSDRNPHSLLGRYLLYPFIMTIAFRLGIKGAGAAGALLFVVATGVVCGRYSQDISIHDFDHLAWSLQSFLCVTLFSNLLFAAVVTEGGKSRESLAQGEKRYRLLFNKAPLGILQFDREGTVIDGNDRLEEIMGASREAYHKFNFPLGLKNPGMLEAVRKCLAGETGYFEGPYRSVVSGKELHLRSFFNALRDDSGNIVGGMCLLEDIGDRVRAEEEVLRLHQENQLILNCVGEGIIRLDAKGRITFANPYAIDALGYSPEEIIGKDLHALVHHNTADGIPFSPVECPTYETLQRGTSYRIRNEVFWRKAGRSFPVAYSSTPILEDGQIKGAVISFRDITERVQAERKRADLEAQLRHSQKIESLGTLAGGIAHDFNNILSAIMGYTDLALDGMPKGGHGEDCLHQVMKASARARDLVRQILLFARKGEQKQLPVMILPLVKETVKLVRATLPSTILIKQDYSVEPNAHILADPTQIHQVLMNLCSNSAHAMREKGGTLEIRLMEVEWNGQKEKPAGLSGGRYVLLQTVDDGCGIAPEVLHRIFDPFFTTKGPGEGTGMGLAVAHGIVRDHGGAITVSSGAGEQTRFSVYLPRLENPRTVEKAPVGNIPSGTERILFVDDEEEVALAGKASLERLGYRVTMATDSIKALNLFKAGSRDFDLVITDYTMPRMTGAGLARSILEVKPDIPVILLSGYSQAVSEKEAGEIGIKAYLSKPVPREDLARVIRQVLEHRE